MSIPRTPGDERQHPHKHQSEAGQPSPPQPIMDTPTLVNKVISSKEEDHERLVGLLNERLDAERAGLGAGEILGKENAVLADFLRVVDEAHATGAPIDLSRVNLSRTDLSHINIIGADLMGADLSRANLFKALLRKTNLSGANLTDANLQRAKLTKANLFEADLENAVLTKARLTSLDQLKEAKHVTAAQIDSVIFN